jgi:hypothetical protein
MAGVFVVCPNGEGDPFACEPFCELCEGSGQVVETGHVFGVVCVGRFCSVCSVGGEVS